MLQFAAGWLGWTEEVALSTDINYVVAAYEGRLGMFQLLFGKRKEAEEEEPKKKVTANEIRTWARTHNALVKTGKIKLQAPAKNGAKRK